MFKLSVSVHALLCEGPLIRKLVLAVVGLYQALLYLCSPSGTNTDINGLKKILLHVVQLTQEIYRIAY